MKADDKVRFFNARTGEIMEETYTIVEVLDNKSVKVKSFHKNSLSCANSIHNLNAY